MTAVVEEDEKLFQLVTSNMDRVITGAELTMNLTNREVSYDR